MGGWGVGVGGGGVGGGGCGGGGGGGGGGYVSCETKPSTKLIQDFKIQLKHYNPFPGAVGLSAVECVWPSRHGSVRKMTT